MENTEKELLRKFKEEDKQFLKKRIFTSIKKYRNKRRIKYLSLAASILIIIAVSGFFYIKINSFDNSYANVLDGIDTNGLQNVSLVLTNKTIVISETDSVIAYSDNNNKIRIGNSKVEEELDSKLNKMIVPYGRRSQLQLSDGTHIWLNSGSKLVYPSTFTGEKRMVYLEGEAIFDVAHNVDHPFIVMTKNHEIEVLGTVFNVSSYSDEEVIKTALKSGSVKISYLTDGFIPQKKSLRIVPGTVAMYDKTGQTITTKTGDVSDYFIWRNGLIAFRNDNLKYILNRVSRYYNVPIQFNNKSRTEQTFSGYIDLKNNIEDVLDIIKESSNFSYNRKNNSIIIN